MQVTEDTNDVIIGLGSKGSSSSRTLKGRKGRRLKGEGAHKNDCKLHCYELGKQCVETVLGVFSSVRVGATPSGAKDEEESS